MTVKSLFDDFILSKRLADLSKKTIQDYCDFLRSFVALYGDMNISLLTMEHINDYISTVLERDISKSTRSTYIRNIKIFLKWIADRYSVLYDYRQIRVPKSPKKKVQIYDVSEIEMLFSHIQSSIDWIEKRNKCIIALMIDSGLRLSEVSGLLRKRVYFDDKYMVVSGKGDKERVVPVGEFSAVMLEEYLAIVPYGSKYVFVNRLGEPLTSNAVKLLVRKISKELPFELSAHKLRHNFATNYCLDMYNDKGVIDIYKLMAILGHEDLSTTKRYLHHANEIIAVKEHLSHLDKVIYKKGV